MRCYSSCHHGNITMTVIDNSGSFYYNVTEYSRTISAGVMIGMEIGFSEVWSALYNVLQTAFWESSIIVEFD